MLDKNQELHDFINESFNYPEDLSSTEDKLIKRIKKEKRKKRAIISSISTIAASLMFILLVNTSTAFAGIVSEIPLIGKIAEYVKFDKGLKSAIENDYMQEVGLVSYDEQEKLLLPYVIADEKNLVLFFQLQEEFKQIQNQWVNISLQSMINSTTGEKVEGFGYSTSALSADAREQNMGLIMHDFHFSEGTLPRSIDIEVVVNVETIKDSEEKTVQEGWTDTEAPKLEKIGTFKFHIDFNEFKEPVAYPLNENLIIMGQKITVEDVKVYPTGTEVSFLFDKDNTAWIKGFELEVEQSDGTVLKRSNGISASMDEKNGWMRVFIESNYFEKPIEQKLIIKGIRLLDKNEEFITVDLDNKTFTPLINDTELIEVSRREGKADLVFRTKLYNEGSFGMFSHEYKDLEGNIYNIKTEGATSRDSQMETYITVEYPQSGKVILQRSLTQMLKLEEPITIPLP